MYHIKIQHMTFNLAHQKHMISLTMSYKNVSYTMSNKVLESHHITCHLKLHNTHYITKSYNASLVTYVTMLPIGLFEVICLTFRSIKQMSCLKI